MNQLTPEKRKHARKLYSTMTPAEIARAVGTCASTIKRWMCADGWVKSFRIQPKVTAEQIRDGIKAGKMASEIAKKHDCHVTRIYDIAKLHNITLNISEKPGRRKQNPSLIAITATFTEAMAGWKRSPELHETIVALK